MRDLYAYLCERRDSEWSPAVQPLYSREVYWSMTGGKWLLSGVSIESVDSFCVCLSENKENTSESDICLLNASITFRSDWNRVKKRVTTASGHDNVECTLPHHVHREFSILDEKQASDILSVKPSSNARCVPCSEFEVNTSSGNWECSMQSKSKRPITWRSHADTPRRSELECKFRSEPSSSTWNVKRQWSE